MFTAWYLSSCWMTSLGNIPSITAPTWCTFAREKSNKWTPNLQRQSDLGMSVQPYHEKWASGDFMECSPDAGPPFPISTQSTIVFTLVRERFICTASINEQPWLLWGIWRICFPMCFSPVYASLHTSPLSSRQNTFILPKPFPLDLHLHTHQRSH